MSDENIIGVGKKKQTNKQAQKNPKTEMENSACWFFY